MATHSSILAWKIPWTEETGGLQSKGTQRVRHKLNNCALTLCTKVSLGAKDVEEEKWISSLFRELATPNYKHIQIVTSDLDTNGKKRIKPILLLPFKMLVCTKSLQPRLTLRLYGLKPTRLLCPWDSPGKNTRVGCHALLQRIFPTQGPNWSLLCLLHW